MSATYQITSLTTLETSTASLDRLSRSLLLNSIVSCDGQPIGLVTHWDLVFLARTWASWALDAAQKPPEEALVALSLVDQWLQDPHSVSREELNAAARAAGAARAAARAAGAAEAAAEAAAAGAAARAAWAARAAARAAAEAAEAAAEAAARAAWAAEAASYQRQGKFIIEHLKNSSQTSFPFPTA